LGPEGFPDLGQRATRLHANAIKILGCVGAVAVLRRQELADGNASLIDNLDGTSDGLQLGNNGIRHY